MNELPTPAGGFPPFQNTPFVDDWGWAWPVEHLLRTGRLEILDASTNPHVAQVVWGSLFCYPFGFSFAALRLSTAVLAVAGLWGLYLLLRELDVARPHALVGTATLAVHPVFAMLSVTFMTDVPFVSLVILTVFATVRALRRRNVGWLVAAAACAALSIAVRLPGVVTPVAMLLTLCFAPDAWGRRRGRWAIAVVPLVVFVALIDWWQPHTYHVADQTWITGSPVNRFALMKEFGLGLLPRMLGDTMALIWGAIGLALLPVSLASLRHGLLKTTLAVFVCLAAPLVVMRAFGFEYVLPLLTGNTWAANELGGMSPLVPEFNGPVVPAAIGWLGLAVGTFSIASAAVACVASGSPRPTIASACRNVIARPPVMFLVLLIAGYTGLTALLWLIADRYALVFVPLFIGLVLSARPALSVRTAVAVLACYALFTAAGVRDDVHYNAALWRAVGTLRASKVPDSEINGGYVVNGWLQYAHPEQAHRDRAGNVDVPWVNGAYEPRYRVSNHTMEGWETLQTIGYERWLQPPGAVYVIRRIEN